MRSKPKQKTHGDMLENYLEIIQKKELVKSGIRFFKYMLRSCGEKDLVKYETKFYKWGKKLASLQKQESLLFDQITSLAIKN